MIPADKTRRSAKDIINQLANELMQRQPSPDTDAKLLLIETIASRMSWMDLFYRIRNRTKKPAWAPYKD